jgi:cytochrome c biogenesis protein CcdA
MRELVFLVVSIGLADSLNPSTVGPAIYLALGKHPRRRVGLFTAGVFCVYLLGGIVLTLGPMRAVPQPGGHLKHVLEVALGAALVAFAAVAWFGRNRLGRTLAKGEEKIARSPFLLGAGIMALELPTALPYFAVIAALAASGKSIPVQVLLLVAFNVAFVLPLIAIIFLRTVAGERAAGVLGSMRAWLDRNTPALLATLLLLIGLSLIVVGGVALLRD